LAIQKYGRVTQKTIQKEFRSRLRQGPVACSGPRQTLLRKVTGMALGLRREKFRPEKRRPKRVANP